MNILRGMLIFIITHLDPSKAIEILKHFRYNDILLSVIDKYFINETMSDIDYNVQSYILEMKRMQRYMSGRPKTSREFQSDKCNDYPIIVNDGILVKDMYLYSEEKGEHLIPVIRYEAESGSGIYTGGYDKSKIRGTYYYFEPESNFYLKSTNTLFIPNKFLAYLYLKGEMDRYITRFLNMISRNNNDMIKDMIKDMEYKNHLFDFKKSREGMYGMEDIFDDPLYFEGKKKGYDVICLIYMQGKNRIVSEIVDLRDRDVSYNSICEK